MSCSLTQTNTIIFDPFSEEKILYLTPEQEKDKSHFTDKEVFQIWGFWVCSQCVGAELWTPGLGLSQAPEHSDLALSDTSGQESCVTPGFYTCFSPVLPAANAKVV